jgi:serine/threonine protein kinase
MSVLAEVPELPRGHVVGSWRIAGLIGHGAWGSVYAAEPVGPVSKAAARLPLALKIFPVGGLSRGQGEMLREMAWREADFSTRARHPHLLRTLAVHRLSEPDDPHLDGAVVMVMERAVESVRHVLLRAASGRLIPRCVELLAQICDAMAYLHGRGWVHGDLKPGNVLIMANGSARVADFGVTSQLDGTHAYAPRIGSPDYLPPEWWSERVCERGVPVRTTADIWAFGVLAHQMLAGGLHPFPGTIQSTRVSTVQAYANGTVPLSLDERVPPPWRRLITDCLAPDHEARSAHDALSLRSRIRQLPEPEPRPDAAFRTPPQR